MHTVVESPRTPLHILSQELLRDAAKARLRRMVAPKKKRGDLEVPGFVVEEWNKGSLNRDDMADLLLQHNMNKDAAAAHSAHVHACATAPISDPKLRKPLSVTWKCKLRRRTRLSWSRTGGGTVKPRCAVS